GEGWHLKPHATLGWCHIAASQGELRDQTGEDTTWIQSETVSSKPQDRAGDHRRQRLADGASCLEYGLRYLQLRWAVLAVCPPDHVGVGKQYGQGCTSPGKAPWGEWKIFQERLPTEQELRRKWQDNPTLNVGVALGPVSGLIRVDVDGAKGEIRLEA